MVGKSAGERDNERTVAVVHVHLLGRFEVVRGSSVVREAAWQRRSARQLVKMLASQPSHARHREQLVEGLWPEVDAESARNSLAKALHAARRALEPDRSPREGSPYLHLYDEIVSLDADQVVVDADEFEWRAGRAAVVATPAAYEAALAAYGGELLPEDLYEEWTQERRRQLGELHAQVRVGLAEALVAAGEHLRALEHLYRTLQADPTREDVYRRLMQLYAQMGARGLAARQFEACRRALDENLGAEPDAETQALYYDIVHTARWRPPARPVLPGLALPVLTPLAPARPTPPPLAVGSLGVRPRAPEGGAAPFVGRAVELASLDGQLQAAKRGTGSVVVVRGEAGVGKTRLVEKFVAGTAGAGVLVLGTGREPTGGPYGPLGAALEGYVASLPAAERQELGARFAALGHLVPSLDAALPWGISGPADAELFAGIEIVQVLERLGARQTLLVVLGDLGDAHSQTIRLVAYLAMLAPRRPWLLVATVSEEAVAAHAQLAALVDGKAGAPLCVPLVLGPLTRPEADLMVQGLVPGRGLPAGTLERLYALAGGNPLFVEQLVADMRRRGELRGPHPLPADLPGAGHVPRNLAARVEMAVAPFEHRVRQVIDLVAVAGGEVAGERLDAACGRLHPPIPPSERAAAWAQAARGGILVDRGATLAVRHPLVQAALAETISPHRRDQLRAALEDRRTEPDQGADGLRPPPVPVRPALGRAPARAGAPLRPDGREVGRGGHPAR